MSTASDILSLKTRVTNLEERVKDLTIAHQQFVSNLQVTEVIAVLTEEISSLREDIASLKTRLTIVEELPDII